MKIKVDVDSELWGRFRSKVINDKGKPLDRVLVEVVEGAFMKFLEPPVFEGRETKPLFDSGELPIIDRVTPLKPVATVSIDIRRCELCDNPTERLFASEGRKVCYACWKAAITAIPVPPPPAPPEAA